MLAVQVGVAVTMKINFETKKFFSTLTFPLKISNFGAEGSVKTLMSQSPIP